ncbi:MAG: lipoprotein [Frankiales bacterium]|nr:lipoprotein [Frankiales bacterium]
MRRSLIALPVAALLLAAACGGSPKQTVLSQDYGAVLRSSVTKSSATSSKVDLSIVTKTPGTAVTIAGTGAFDGNVGSMVLTVGSSRIQERVTGGKLYLKVPGQSTWYVLTLSQLVGTSLAGSASPSDSTQVLLAADNHVTKVGTEQVRGASATHYKGAIALDAAHLAKLGGLAKPAVQKLVDSGVTSLPFDAWVDGQDRLVKMVESVDVTIKTVTAHVTTTVERYAFGTAVTVTAPPASQQTDGAPLLAGIKAQTG